MNTVSPWKSVLPEIPMGSVWLLNDLSEYRGKQELFARQSPQKLKALREHALIESAVSSNRIEGVEVDQKRIGTVLFGKGHLQDRDEEEVRGYQQALSWIHSGGTAIPLSVETILKLHAMTRPNIWDSGCFKKDDGEIIEQSKERYYDTLRDSSQGWHEAEHNPWPYINYLLYTIKELYREFEERYENTALPFGEKTKTVLNAINSFPEDFHITELQKKCPGVSIDLIRKILGRMKKDGEIICKGRGKLARWSLLGNRQW